MVHPILLTTPLMMLALTASIFPLPHPSDSGSASTDAASLCVADSTAAGYDGVWVCSNPQVKLVLDTQNESIEVPDYGFLGPTHGYMAGSGIYGTWIVTTCTRQKNVLTVRLANDTGGDAQTAQLTLKGDTALTYEAVGGNALRYVVKRKLVKAPSTFIFHRPEKRRIQEQ